MILIMAILSRVVVQGKFQGLVSATFVSNTLISLFYHFFVYLISQVMKVCLKTKR